jgi:hypothetical protein
MPATGLIPKANGLPGTLPKFSNAGSVASAILIFLVAVILFSLIIGAVFVRMATQIVAGFTPSYGMACTAIIFSIAASIVVGIFIALFSAAGGSQISPLASSLSILLGLVVHAAIYGTVLRDGTEPIGFGKGFLVILFQQVLAIVIFIVLGIIAAVTVPLFFHHH